MNFDLIYALLGVVVALATSIIKQEHWNNTTKSALNTVLSFVGGLVTVYFQTNGTSGVYGLIGSWAAILGISQAMFAFVLKPTQLDRFLTTLKPWL